MLTALPAQAHTRLEGSSPAAGAVVPTGTDTVVLEFSGAVRAELSTVVVNGPGGASGTRGPVVVQDGRVTQPLAAPLAAGAWTVAYRVVAADGHPITGSLDLQVAGSAGAPTGTDATLGPAQLQPVAVGGPVEREATRVPVVLAGLGVGALALAAVLGLRRRSRAAPGVGSGPA